MLRSLLNIPKLVFFIISKFTPRDENIWVFGANSGQDFFGNPKYFYLYLNGIDCNIRPVWVCESDLAKLLREEGYEAYSQRSVKGMIVSVRAKYIFGNNGVDIPWEYTGGGTIVEMWHGNGIKNLGKQKENHVEDSFVIKYLKRVTNRDWNYLVVSSKGEPSKRLVEAYELNDTEITSVGFPRTDVLFEKVNGSYVPHGTYPYETIRLISGNFNTILYAPTFRNDGSKIQGIPLSSSDFDPSSMNEFLINSDSVLFIKFHPHEKDVFNLEDYNRIIELPPNLDIYPALDSIDVLVTDYSSIYLDYILLDRPMVFYAYDRKEYSSDRGLYFDYDQITPGGVAHEFDELLIELRECLNRNDYSNERQEVKERFHDHEKGKSCKNLYETLRDG